MHLFIIIPPPTNARLAPYDSAAGSFRPADHWSDQTTADHLSRRQGEADSSADLSQVREEGGQKAYRFSHSQLKQS